MEDYGRPEDRETTTELGRPATAWLKGIVDVDLGELVNSNEAEPQNLLMLTVTGFDLRHAICNVPASLVLLLAEGGCEKRDLDAAETGATQTGLCRIGTGRRGATSTARPDCLTIADCLRLSCDARAQSCLKSPVTIYTHTCIYIYDVGMRHE